MSPTSDPLARAFQALRAGSFVQAEQLYRQVLQADPANAFAWFGLGAACQCQGKLAEADAHYRQALALRPDFAEAHSNAAILLAAQGRLEDAVAGFRRALQVNPHLADALNGLGTALHALGQLPEAEAHLRQAIRLKPDFAEAHYNLGNTLYSRDLPDAAEDQFREAVRLRPADAKAHANLGTVLRDQGRLDEAIAAYRQALALQPGNARVHSNLLYALLHHAQLTPEQLFAEHRRWAQLHAEPLAAPFPPATADRRPDRRLRLGYVSPDFRQHVATYFIEPFLAAHDHGQFEITCYADVARPDAVTRRFQGYADRWRSLVGLSDDQAARLIREDGIDILIDLAGHTAGNRLLVFARQPAPVQVSYVLGYPATTGLRTIAYHLTDAVVDPPGTTEAHHSEALVRLPGPALIFHTAEHPQAGPLPARATGHVTFGSFNRLPKLNPETLTLWARILTALPQARLTVLVGSTQRGKHRLLEALDRAGIPAHRVTCLDKVYSHADYLQLFQGIDICLDTFPYHGVTTTCEALTMGVPVVTRAGRASVARQGVSFLTHLGRPEWVAATPDDYVAIAVRLASDLGELERLRGHLARQMRETQQRLAGPFTRHLEAVYRRMWAS